MSAHWFDPRKLVRWETPDGQVGVRLPDGVVIQQSIDDVSAQIMEALDHPGAVEEWRVALLRALAGEENWLAAVEIHRQVRSALPGS